jgi:hypothetical protein
VRGVRFQDVADAVLSQRLIEIIESPGRRGQQAFVFWLKDYVWVAPFVLERDGTMFLKTAYSSLKLMDRYGGPDGEADRP